jgi:hypothetical protein
MDKPLLMQKDGAGRCYYRFVLNYSPELAQDVIPAISNGTISTTVVFFLQAAAL